MLSGDPSYELDDVHIGGVSDRVGEYEASSLLPGNVDRLHQQPAEGQGFKHRFQFHLPQLLRGNNNGTSNESIENSGSTVKIQRKTTMENIQEGEELITPQEPGGINPNAITDKETTPLVHLYRAEVGRLAQYRQRLDTTTNWTVTITSALVAFSLGSESTAHYFFGFIVIMQIIFCSIEARRHVYYNLVRHRCRLMERGMYAHILAPNLPSAHWRIPLRESYLESAKLMPLHTAFLIRLKRNYAFLIFATYIGWTFKLLSTESFLYQFFIPISLIELPFTLWIVFFYKDQALDV